MNVPRAFRPRLNSWILAWWLGRLIFPIRGADPSGEVAPLNATQTLTNPATIRGLTPAQARAGIPVELEGVVTWMADNSAGGFLDDGTAPVWIEGKLPEGVRTGSRLRVRGKTNPGSFTPTVILTNLPEILGTLELPVPREVLGRDLQLGKWDGFQVTFSGTAFDPPV